MTVGIGLQVPALPDLLFFRSRPVTVAATKLVFQLIAASIALYFLYLAFVSLSEAAADGVFLQHPLAIRLSILGLRNTSAPPAACNTLVFGLLHNGCPSSSSTNTSKVSNGSVVFVLPTSAQDSGANGYYFQISAGMPAASDPVLWTVEAQATEGGVWLPVGASVWRGQGKLATYFPSLPYPTPESAVSADWGICVLVDRRPRWEWLLTDVGTYVVAGVGWGMYSAAGMARRQLVAVRLLGMLFSFNSGLQAVAAVGYCVARDWRAGVEAWMNCAAVAGMAVVLVFNERFVINGIIIFGGITLLTQVLCTPPHAHVGVRVQYEGPWRVDTDSASVCVCLYD